MSDRSWASDLWKVCVGHQCLMLHMPTIRRVGAVWNMERGYELAGWTGRNANGWPDTETGFSLDLRCKGIVPKILGREQNFQRCIDENIDHPRTFTGARVYLMDPALRARTDQWMREALADARARAALWKRNAVSKSRVLVLVPLRPSLPDNLKTRCRELLARLPAANPSLDLEIVVDDRGPWNESACASLEAKVAHTAPIRQAMIDQYLKTQDYVLWVDADVVDYPADLPAQLLARNPRGVSAPVVLLEEHGEHFFDIAGFVEQGRWARVTKPWFDQPGPVYDLDGVGCVYMVPAAVYRSGVQHGPCPGFTDHLLVCQRARALGLSVRAYEDLTAIHADYARWEDGR
jgi:hypothetical protein